MLKYFLLYTELNKTYYFSLLSKMSQPGQKKKLIRFASRFRSTENIPDIPAGDCHNPARELSLKSEATDEGSFEDEEWEKFLQDVKATVEDMR